MALLVALCSASPAALAQSAPAADGEGGGSNPPPAQTSPPPGPPAGPSTQSPVPAANGNGGNGNGNGKPARRWGMAPIFLRWGGYSLLSYRRLNTKSDNAKDTTDSIQSVTSLSLTGDTYFWQPWFARLNGTLGFSWFTQKQKGESKSDSLELTGDGRFTMFPQSRFPFEAYFERRNTKVSGDLVANDFDVLRYGLIQNYRTPKGDQNYSVNYEHSEFDSDAYGKDSLDVLRAFGNYTVPRHSVEGNFSYSNNEQDSTVGKAEVINFGSRYLWRPGDDLSVDNDLTFTDTKRNFDNDNSKNRYYQIGSFALWQPARKPYRITGSVRAIGAENDFGGFNSDTQALNLNAGVIYDYTRNLSMSANAGFTFTDQSNAATQSATISYFADPIPFRDYTYTWTASGNVSNLVSDSSNAQAVGSAFNHTLSRVLPQIFGGNFSYNFNQGVGATLTNTDQRVAAEFTPRGRLETAQGNDVEPQNVRVRLNHAASANWNRADGATQNIVFGSVSDSRELVGDGGAFQLLNLQYTRQAQLGRDSYLAGNMTLQVSRQEFDTEIAGVGTGTTTTLSGDLIYQRERVFGVPRLSFISTLQASGEDVPRFEGNTDAAPDNLRTTLSWDNRLRYQIGKTDLEIRGQYAETDQQKQTFFFIQLRRQLGLR